MREGINKNMDILIDNRSGESLNEESNQLIEKVILNTLVIENIENEVEVSISIVTEEEIKNLNKDFRNIDNVTDVLSFPLYDRCEIENIPKSEMIALGDIVICLEKAKQQSLEYGHSFYRELGFLVSHSMLHLLGYDHITDKDESIMINKQNEILHTIGLKR